MYLNWLWQKDRKTFDTCIPQQRQERQLLYYSCVVPSTLSDEAGWYQSKEAQGRAYQHDHVAGPDRHCIQPTSSRHPHQWTFWMVMLLLLLAATVWVGSSLNLVQEMWAAALNAVFTSLSTMIAVAQWRMQTPPERAHTAPDVHHPFVRTMTSTRKGAVIVYTPRTWRGTALRLVAGLHETTAPCVPIEAVSIVVEDRSRERRMFVCCFPMVPPGHYTLAAPVKQRTTHITVRRSHCAEVDWR